jgi:hypothetical protein
MQAIGSLIDAHDSTLPKMVFYDLISTVGSLINAPDDPRGEPAFMIKSGSHIVDLMARVTPLISHPFPCSLVGGASFPHGRVSPMIS